MAETSQKHDRARTSTPDLGSVAAGKDPRRDGDHGLGDPWSHGGPGRLLSPKEVEECDQQEQDEKRRELETSTLEHSSANDGQDWGNRGPGNPWNAPENAPQPSPTENDEEPEPVPTYTSLSWFGLAAASVLGLLLIGRGVAVFGDIRTLSPPWNWIMGAAAVGSALVLVFRIIRIVAAQRRHDHVPGSLTERRWWRQLAIHHPDRARLRLRRFLKQYGSEANRQHLNEHEQTRLENARQYLLEGRQILSAPEWLEVFSERFQSILDVAAARRVRAHAVKVGIGIAVSRFSPLDQPVVLFGCMGLLRELLVLYGLRSITVQSMRLLTRAVLRDILSDVPQDMAADPAASGLWQEIAEGLEQVGAGNVGRERVSKGVINGDRVWSLGCRAIEQCQIVQTMK